MVPVVIGGTSEWTPIQPDYFGTPEGVSIHVSQSALRQSLVEGGAVRVGPAGIYARGQLSEEIGEIFVLETVHGVMEIRIMQGVKNPGVFSGRRTAFTEPYRGYGRDTFRYPSGARIIGNRLRPEQREIGHVHGQRP